MKKVLFVFAVVFAPMLINAQTQDQSNYDDLMYMNSIYPVEEVVAKVDTSAQTDAVKEQHIKVAEVTANVAKKAVVNPYDMIYAISGYDALIYVDSDPDAEVKAVHVLNPFGLEVLCFPKVEPKRGMIRLDLSSLGPGRYSLLLDGQKYESRDIAINDLMQVVRLR